MNIMLRRDWQEFVDDLVDKGRFGSPTEVVGEALRLLQEREAKLQALRETITASLAEAGGFTDEEVNDAIEKRLVESEKQHESKLQLLRGALIEGEQSGPSAPFDFDAFLAGKRGTQVP